MFMNEVLQNLRPAFGEAILVILQVAVRGGLLVGGVFVGKLLATGFSDDPPSQKKVLLISMPSAVLIAAFWGFFGVVNPEKRGRKRFKTPN